MLLISYRLSVVSLKLASVRNGILPFSGFSWLTTSPVWAAIICGCELNVLTWFCVGDGGQAKWVVAVAELSLRLYVKRPSLPFSVTELV